MLRCDGGDGRRGEGCRAAGQCVHWAARGFFRDGPAGFESGGPGSASARNGRAGGVPLASELRRVFFQARSGTLLLLVFLRRTIDKERALRSRRELPAGFRSEGSAERRVDPWLKF